MVVPNRWCIHYAWHYLLPNVHHILSSIMVCAVLSYIYTYMYIWCWDKVGQTNERTSAWTHYSFASDCDGRGRRRHRRRGGRSDDQADNGNSVGHTRLILSSSSSSTTTLQARNGRTHRRGKDYDSRDTPW